MLSYTNTSASCPQASDVSVKGRPQFSLHALFFLPKRTSQRQFRRGAIVPKLLASTYNNKFFTSIFSVNASEYTLNFITQRLPVFIQQHSPFDTVFKQYSTKGIQDVGKITQEFGQITQGP